MSVGSVTLDAAAGETVYRQTVETDDGTEAPLSLGRHQIVDATNGLCSTVVEPEEEHGLVKKVRDREPFADPSEDLDQFQGK